MKKILVLLGCCVPLGGCVTTCGMYGDETTVYLLPPAHRPPSHRVVVAPPPPRHVKPMLVHHPAPGRPGRPHRR